MLHLTTSIGVTAVWVGPVANSPPIVHAAQKAGEYISTFSLGDGITTLLDVDGDNMDGDDA